MAQDPMGAEGLEKLLGDTQRVLESMRAARALRSCLQPIGVDSCLQCRWSRTHRISAFPAQRNVIPSAIFRLSTVTVAVCVDR